MRAVSAIVLTALAVVSQSCSSTPSAEPSGSGGAASTGGASSGTSGGASSGAGGAVSTGGAFSGGAPSTGGAASGAGGVSSTGGAPGTGGGPGTGGSSADADSGTPSWWKPPAGTTWDWQLSSTDLSHAVEVYDIDYGNDAATVATLHARGLHVICYVSVGSWEDFRPDAASFPTSVIGNDYPGWPGEKFVDIRSPALRSIMSARFDVCKQKGFDGLEPDNMDVFEASSGFPLTQADGLDYARWLASEAHSRGLAVVQKNTSSLAPSLFELYDGALTEDCYDQSWCSDMLGYADRNKPVFMAEYTDTGVDFTAACAWAKTNRFSAILKDRDLTPALTTCP